MTLLWLLVLLTGIAVIAHLRVSPVPALAIVAAYLVLMGAADETPTWLMVILWLMLIAIAVVMFAMCLLWGERRIYIAGTVALVTPFTIFLLFDKVLRVRFPRGLLTNWYYG